MLGALAGCGGKEDGRGGRLAADGLAVSGRCFGFYLLIAARASRRTSGRRDRVPVGRTHCTLAFTFTGLVIGSTVYSLPFVVQPIRNAFAAVGDRPLEVAATLRASPRRAFWTVALPLASPGLLRARCSASRIPSASSASC